MPSSDLVTRADLRRLLVINAATKPLNISVGAGLVVAAVLIGTSWLLAVAVIAYAALVAMTFFDEDEAARVGDRAYGRKRLGAAPRLDPAKLARPIRDRLEAALDEEHAIRQTIAGAQLPFDDVDEEVRALVEGFERTARRAQLVYGYLDGQDPPAVSARLQALEASPPGDPTRDATIEALREQDGLLTELSAQLRRYGAEMEQLVASLSAIHARLVRLALTHDEAGEGAIVGDVRELRERVNTLSAGIEEVYSRTEDGEVAASAPAGDRIADDRPDQRGSDDHEDQA